jgi:DNA primase
VEAPKVDPIFWQAEARFDWRNYVQQHGAVRALQSNGAEYLLQCPDCGKLKLAVNVEKRAWRCFVCSEGGRDGMSLIAKMEGMPWHQSLVRVLQSHRETVGSLDRIEAVLDAKKEAPRRTFKALPYPEGFYFLKSESCFSQIRTGMFYCISRGISGHVIAEMRLGICDHGFMRGRVIFPCFDFGGRLIFYQGRATWNPSEEGRHIKVLSPRSEEGYAGPADCLLNLSYCADRMDVFKGRIIVVEGPVDCAHAWPDAVATYGKRISPPQIELLIRAGVRAIDLCWDADAISEMEKIAPTLADLFTVRIIRLPVGIDPGMLSKPDLERYRRLAAPIGSGSRYQYLS